MSFTQRSRYMLIMWIFTIAVSIGIGFGIVLILERPTVQIGSSAQPTRPNVTALPTNAAPTTTGMIAAGLGVAPPSAAALGPTAAPTKVEHSPTTVAASSSPLPAAAAPAKVEPTTAASPSPQPAATHASSAPTAQLPAASAALKQVAATEAALRSGEFAATLDYGNGTRSSSVVRFDLGDASHPVRLHITTTYTDSGKAQTTERIAIGGKTWQRQANGKWVGVAEQQEALAQLQTFLPHAARVVEAQLDSSGPAITLRWYDKASDADVALDADPASGAPRELHQTIRGAKTTLTVIYRGWNTPIEVQPPPGA